MLLSLQTAAAATPVSVAEAKAHLRVEHTDEDTLITNLIAVAVAEFEGRQGSTRRAFVTQIWDMFLPHFPGCRHIELPMPPLQSVTHIKYYDASNVEQTLSTDNYEVVTAEMIGRVTLKPTFSWPATYDREQAVSIRFTCGYGNAAAVPANLRHAILLRIGELYNGRGDEATPDMRVPISRLLNPSRVVRLK